MTAFATTLPGYSSVDISETDADGMGHMLVSIRYGNAPGAGMWTAEMAAKLLVLARNMDQGWAGAIDILRAESVRQRAAT